MESPQPTVEPVEETEVVAKTPNGVWLYRKRNEAGGYTYFSDEVGGGVFVWDTCCVSPVTLKLALALEGEL
jgi:hypothetical protein